MSNLKTCLMLGSMAMAVAVSGCTTPEGERSNVGGPIRIEDAFIVDSANREVRGFPTIGEIEPSSGTLPQLQLNFRISGGSTPSYRGEWFLSADPILQSNAALPDADIFILSSNCGTGANEDCPQDAGSADCFYRPDVTLFCGVRGTRADNQALSLSNYFGNTNGLPGRYYLILRAQDPLNAQSEIRVFDVNFN